MDVSLATAARIELAAGAIERGDRALAVGVLLSIPPGERLAASAWMRALGVDLAALLTPARGAA